MNYQIWPAAEADLRRNVLGSTSSLLVEDHPVIRILVTSILNKHCILVGTLERGDEVIDAVQNLRPDVVILDISLPGKSGLEVLPELRGAHSGLGIVMLTSHEEPDCIEEAFRSGADAYIFKRHALEYLWPAVMNASITRVGHAA